MKACSTVTLSLEEDTAQILDAVGRIVGTDRADVIQTIMEGWAKLPEVRGLVAREGFVLEKDWFEAEMEWYEAMILDQKPALERLPHEPE